MTKFLPICILLSVFLPPHVAANDHGYEHEASERTIVSLPAGEVVNQDYFAIGELVEISGTVNGDVYAAGGSILVDGKITGDLLAVGGTVTISGTINQDVRVVGGQVSVSGNLERNLTLGAGNAEFEQGSIIHGSVVTGVGNAHLAGLIKGNVMIAAGNLVISNTIGGNLQAATGGIRLTSHAKVERDFTYWSPQTASIDTQAKIIGAVTQKPIPTEFLPPREDMLAWVVGLVLLFKTASFVSTLVLGLLIIRVYPKFFQKGIVNLQQKPLNVLGLGVLVFLLTPILIGFLGMTVIGLPLALFFLALFFVYLYLCRIFVIAWAGQRIFAWFSKERYEKCAFFGGLLIYFFLSFFPVVGPLLTFFTILFGLGTILLTKNEYYEILRNQELV